MKKPEVTRRGLIAGAGAATAGAVLISRSAAADPAAGATAAPLPSSSEPIPVAFLLDEGATMIDFAGPWEVFQDAEEARVPGFRLFTVAPSLQPIRSSGGMRVLPDYTLENAPPAKVIVIPAQAGGRSSTPGNPKVSWLKKQHASADVIMSVCTGAFLLARTGLLDGLKGTTHHLFLDDFAKLFPKVQLLKNQRFVDNGKLITTGGLSSGIEGALHVIERYHGPRAKNDVAHYMEYVSHTWSEA